VKKSVHSKNKANEGDVGEMYAGMRRAMDRGDM
jgi:hypothetical protein